MWSLPVRGSGVGGKCWLWWCSRWRAVRVARRSLGGLSLLGKGDKRARDLRPTRTIIACGLCDQSSIPMIKLCDHRALSGGSLPIIACHTSYVDAITERCQSWSSSVEARCRIRSTWVFPIGVPLVVVKPARSNSAVIDRSDSPLLLSSNMSSLRPLF